MKARLEAIAGSRLTRDGVLILRGEAARSQEMNRREVRDRLIDLIREATIVPKRRRPTKPGKMAKARRLDSKAKRGTVKSLRGKPVE